MDNNKEKSTYGKINLGAVRNLGHTTSADHLQVGHRNLPKNTKKKSSASSVRLNLVHGLLLWRQTRNQVFQDDVREGKREEGKDIRDLHRYPIDNSLSAIFSSSSSICQTRNLPNLNNFDSQACF